MTPWYLRPKAQLPAALAGVVDRLIEQDAPRLDRYDRNGKLYGGRRRTPASERKKRLGISMPGPTATTDNVGAHSEDDLAGMQSAPMRINVIKAAVNTIVAKVGTLRPRPTFLTDGGNWSLQQKAKQLQRFIDGAYHQSDTYQLCSELFRDAMVYGTGVLLPYGCGAAVKRPRLKAERVPPWEFFVDEDDAEYGNPLCLYRERYVSRARVRQVWGEAALPKPGVANDGTTFYTTGGPATDDGDEYLRVFEAWYRPRDPSGEVRDGTVNVKHVGTDGRHVIVVENNVVEDDYFPYSEFPPVFYHWSPPPTGFWGDSAVQELEGIQVEINRLLKSAQDSMRLVGHPMVFVHEDCTLTPKLSNTPGQAYVWTGNIPPQVTAHQAISPQHLNHLWQLYAKAFEILGSNQLAASATAPPGMESGRAVERLSEEHSERFKDVSRRFNYTVGESLARRFILLAKQLDAETPGGFSLRSPARRSSDRIKWSEVDIDSDNYVLQVFDTSVLPTQPSARIQEVERLQAAAQIDIDEARRLLDFPDLEQSNSFATADYDNLLWQFERMLEHGDDLEPEPYQNLQRVIKLGPAAILRAQRDGAPRANIDKLRAFVDMAVAADQAAQMAAMAAAAPAGAPPGAPPPGGPNTDADRRNDQLSMAAPPDAMPVV